MRFSGNFNPLSLSRTDRRCFVFPIILFATIANTISRKLSSSQSLKACNRLLNTTILLLLLQARVRIRHLYPTIAKQMNMITSFVVAAILVHT